MKRATGPGRVEELSAPPGRDDLVQGALLFNFDFDDDVVKPEHREWLDVNAVPLLRANNGAKAFLNGTASQVGAADHNRDLSKRRVGDVKRFLASKGVLPGRLTASFSGEDTSVSRLADDERDRAVCVWLQVADAGTPRVIPHTPEPADALRPPAGGAARLSLGFALGAGTLFADAVPSLSSTNVEVRPNELGSCTVINGVGRDMFLKKAGTPTSSSSHITATAKLFDGGRSEGSQNGRVKIVTDPQVVSVLGRFPGRNDIVFTKPASTFVDIVGTVTVLADVKVFFHFVDGPPGVKTSRTPGDEAAAVATMNRIYRRQAGIVFASAGVNPKLNVPGVNARKVAGRVGLPVSKGALTPEAEAIVNNRKPEFLFNVFFVGDFVDLGNLDSGGIGEDFLALTSFSHHTVPFFIRPFKGPGRCCLFRDSQPRDVRTNFGRTLAHEAGHALDEEDLFEEAQKDRLMFHSASEATGSKIPFLQAFDMVRSVVAFPP